MTFENTLYLVADSVVKNPKFTLEEIVEAAISGGVDIVQLRDKNDNSRLFYEKARSLKQICKKHDIPFIVNDRVDIALAVDADGIHIGNEDLPLPIVKRIAPSMIIGFSASNIDEAIYGEENGADYIGIGTIFPTTSKSDAGDAIGTEKLKEITSKLNIPSIAIGGINPSNARSCIEAGANGIAVISAITLKDDVENAARELKRIITN